MGGEDEWTLRLNSAQIQLKLPTGAELGNMSESTAQDSKQSIKSANYFMLFHNRPEQVYALYCLA